MRNSLLLLMATCLAAIVTMAQPQVSLLRNFEPNASGYSEDNAYTLAYLTTMVYAQNLPIEVVGTDQTDFREDLERDPIFLFTTFMQRVNDLLGEEGIDYTFVHSCLPTGYDPEAMVINTSKGIFVIFRGTDRVGCAEGDGTVLGDIIAAKMYDAAEWISTDFDIRQVDFRYPATAQGTKLGNGKVHRGFWHSLAANEFSYSITRGSLLSLSPAARTAAVNRSAAVNRALTQRRVTFDTTKLSAGPKNLGLRARALSSKPRALRRDQPFIATLEDVVRGYAAGAGATKKIWIAGHSLGGAHAQLAGMFLKKRGFNVQGIYGFAGPNVGSKEFADDLEATFPGHRLTRFVFAQDPIPTLATDKVGFGSAGKLVHFDDIETRRIVNTDAEIVSGGGSILRAVSGGITSAANSAVGVESGLETVCFHYPQWYLHATYLDLIRREPTRLGAVRAPLPSLPDMRVVNGARIFTGCSQSIIDRGTKKNLGNALAETGQAVVDAAADAAMNFVYDVTFALGNEIGNADFEGVYRIECYASRRANNAKHLDRDGNSINLSKLGAETADNEFVIRRSGIGGYTIGRPGSSRLLTPKAEGLDLLANNHEYDMTFPEVELSDCPWNDPFCGETRRVPSIEQTWRFYKLKEADNLFIIENRLGGKVIDANNACSVNDARDCKVKQWDRRSNDATQLWTLRRLRGL